MKNDLTVLFERALELVMSEWGMTREQALEWLDDDSSDWAPVPPQKTYDKSKNENQATH